MKSEVSFSGICVSPSLNHRHLGDHLRFNDDDENDDNDDSLHCHNSGYRCKTFLQCAFKMLLDMLSTEARRGEKYPLKLYYPDDPPWPSRAKVGQGLVLMTMTMTMTMTNIMGQVQC